MDRKTKSQIAKVLLAAADALDGGKISARLPMQDIPGEGEVEWPEPPGWETDTYAHRKDAFGGWDGMTYQNNDQPALFVEFKVPTFEDKGGFAGGDKPFPLNRGPYFDPSPAEPGKVEMRLYGELKTTTWSTPNKIPQILKFASQWGQKVEQKTKTALERLAGDWDFDMSGGVAYFQRDGVEVSTDIDFDGQGEAQISLGRSGPRRTVKYRSLNDLKRVLQKAGEMA